MLLIFSCFLPPGDPLSPPPYPPETFDRVLLDAPCSALGQRPQLSVNMSLNSLKSYPRLQRKLFSVVSSWKKTDWEITSMRWHEATLPVSWRFSRPGPAFSNPANPGLVKFFILISDPATRMRLEKKSYLETNWQESFDLIRDANRALKNWARFLEAWSG